MMDSDFVAEKSVLVDLAAAVPKNLMWTGANTACRHRAGVRFLRRGPFEIERFLGSCLFLFAAG